MAHVAKRQMRKSNFALRLEHRPFEFIDEKRQRPEG